MAFATIQAINSLTFHPPPLDGSLTVPEIFDHHREHSPDHPLFVYDVAGTVEVITWSHAVRAVHTAARYVEQSLNPDKTHDKTTTIAILANADTFTYFTMIVGIMRAGYRPFPISPRNSAAGTAHLLQTTGSRYLIVSHDPGVQRLAASTCTQMVRNSPECSPHLVSIPTFDYLFGGTEEEFEPLPPIQADPMDIGLILHTSGSMSYPKPVPMVYLNLLKFGLAPYFGDCDLCGLVFSCHALPMYHAVGCVMVPMTMTTGLTVSSFAPHDSPSVPNPDRVFAGAVSTRSDYIFSVPSFLEAWSRDCHRLTVLQEFRALIFAGAPMHKDTGDRLAESGVKVIPFYGSTEIGPAVAFVPNSPSPYGWEYFKFSPQCNPVFIPEGDGVYRLLFLDCPTHSPNILNTKHNGMKAFDTRDLVLRHPENPEVWRVYGRCDEQIVHSTGEKTNPLPIESLLVRHPKVQSAVMFGRGRYHTGVIIQPTPEEVFDPRDENRLARYRNDIWPLVEQANDRSPTQSRLFKEMIIVTDPSKPFELTGKGTPRRAAVLNAYQYEIEHAYVAVEESSQTDIPSPEIWELDECISFVRMAVVQVLHHEIAEDDDIFQVGCDSLKATWIRNAILHALRHSAKVSTRKIPHNFVYSNPTIRRLGTYVTQIIHFGQHAVALLGPSGRIAEMENFLQHYSAKFPVHREALLNPPGEYVLLTGSTGFLGSHILEQLVKDPNVQQIYTLNRKDPKGRRSVYARHESIFREHSLNPNSLLSNKIVFLEGDTCLENFDLGEEAYRHIQSNTTRIIHNAWHVDFNVSLSSMEPVIAGTRHLIDFALTSPLTTIPRLLFVSTLGIFINWTGGPLCPEAQNPRPATAIGIGYTESKWVAENILLNAAEKTPLRPIIVRVGHLCGGRNGSWNPVEWVPTLVRSGQVLQCLPRPEGDITWIPVHIAAGAIAEMRDSEETFLHLVHPRPVSGLPIFATIAKALRVPLVSYAEWLATLEASRHENSGSMNEVLAARDNPALVLLDFFRSLYKPISVVDREAFGFPTAVMSHALKEAPIQLRNVAQLTKDDVLSWIAYWQKIGFLAK